jgi:hypothetical protein
LVLVKAKGGSAFVDSWFKCSQGLLVLVFWLPGFKLVITLSGSKNLSL